MYDTHQKRVQPHLALLNAAWCLTRTWSVSTRRPPPKGSLIADAAVRVASVTLLAHRPLICTSWWTWSDLSVSWTLPWRTTGRREETSTASQLADEAVKEMENGVQWPASSSRHVWCFVLTFRATQRVLRERTRRRRGFRSAPRDYASSLKEVPSWLETASVVLLPPSYLRVVVTFAMVAVGMKTHLWIGTVDGDVVAMVSKLTELLWS
jgi:hypothetical protein